jgi:hypothetical protein
VLRVVRGFALPDTSRQSCNPSLGVARWVSDGTVSIQVSAHEGKHDATNLRRHTSSGIEMNAEQGVVKERVWSVSGCNNPDNIWISTWLRNPRFKYQCAMTSPARPRAIHWRHSDESGVRFPSPL